MSEPSPYYGDRTFVCEVCRREFTPTADEARMLAELEREFHLPAETASAVCAECQARRVQ